MVIVLQQLYVMIIYSEATKFLFFCSVIQCSLNFSGTKPVFESQFWFGVISHTQILPNHCPQGLLHIQLLVIVCAYCSS